MNHLYFFGELGYLINCILPNVSQLNEKTTIHCFEDYQFILAQYCKAKFITVNFHSSIVRSLARGNNDNEYLSKIESKNHPTNLNNIANTTTLFAFDKYKNIPYPISSNPIDMINKSILFNFRNRENSGYGNLSKEFYENLLTNFGNYHIYNCGKLEEIHPINTDNTSLIKFQDIPYVAQNCECCILTDSGLTSMIIKCNPKKVVILFENSEHTIHREHNKIYLKNIENFNTPTKMFFIKNNKLKEEDLLEIINFVNN
jgi:hypothetical protein